MNRNKENEGERLQKVLAAAGHGSRRTIEDWIREGRVTVNGRVAQLGDRATHTDDIRVDGRQVPLVSPATLDREVLIYHKPLGEMTTRRDPQNRPTVFERLPPVTNGRWINVGRLDVNTSGLLLFTTDGELAHRLMHPSTEVEREYLVRLRGQPGPDVIRRLLSGVELDDGPARFDRVFASRTDGSHGWYHVVLREGRNREVRRTWEAVGFEVSRLMRIRYGPIELPRDLAPGGWRKASPALTERLAAVMTVKGAITEPGR
jgi:23S rRNA pseudouridine2605 synthase